MGLIGRTELALGYRRPHCTAAVHVLTLGSWNASAQDVTFTEDLAPVINTHCVTCHRPGAIGPFSLTNYEDVQQRAVRLAEVVSDGLMPPWKPSRGGDTYYGAPALTPEERELFVTWAENGAPRGPEGSLQAAADFDDTTWPLGEPDLVVSMDTPYTVQAGTGVEHRNFALPAGVTERKWVYAIDILPQGSTRSQLLRARIMLDSSGTGQQADSVDTEPGYPGLALDHGVFPEGNFLVWTPGTVSEETRPGLAWPVDPRTDLIVQLAMRQHTETINAQVSVGLYFSDEPPALTSVTVPLTSKTIDIPAGEASYVVEDRYRLPVGVDLLGIYPSMHYLGKEIVATAELPDGSQRDLLTITDWDIDWQDSYYYVSPLHLPEDTLITARFTYDNSTANPRNPSTPPVPVRHGPSVEDEIADLLLQVIPILPRDTSVLAGNLALKQARNDILGFQAQLRREPNNERTHNDIAALYLTVGQLELARDHLQQAITLAPSFADPHFTLGSLLVGEGNTVGAIEEFRRAIEIQPDYSEAHNNLGALLLSSGETEEGIMHYRFAVQFDDRNAGAFFNLANALVAEGELEEATELYREAAAITPNDADVHNNLARVLSADNELSEAVTHYQQAIAINPNLASSLIGLSWILATAPMDDLRNANEAIELAELTVGLVGLNHPEVLDTLAAAYAAAGRFEDAVDTARSAITAAQATAGYAGYAISIQERIALYLQFKPFRTGTE